MKTTNIYILVVSLHSHCVCAMFSMLLPPPGHRLCGGQVATRPGRREGQCHSTPIQLAWDSPLAQFSPSAFGLIFAGSYYARSLCADYRQIPRAAVESRSGTMSAVPFFPWTLFSPQARKQFLWCGSRTSYPISTSKTFYH